MNKWLKFSIIFILIIIFIVLYARFIGTMGFNTKEYTLYENDLPGGFDGIKVVHFSDLHFNRAISRSKVDSIVSEINLINADLVLFTGDLIDRDMNLTNEDYSYLTKAFSKINAKYGKYAVLGNHDYHQYDNVLKVFTDSGFKYLEIVMILCIIIKIKRFLLVVLEMLVII